MDHSAINSAVTFFVSVPIPETERIGYGYDDDDNDERCPTVQALAVRMELKPTNQQKK